MIPPVILDIYVRKIAGWGDAELDSVIWVREV